MRKSDEVASGPSSIMTTEKPPAARISAAVPPPAPGPERAVAPASETGSDRLARWRVPSRPYASHHPARGREIEQREKLAKLFPRSGGKPRDRVLDRGQRLHARRSALFGPRRQRL